jgi:putative Holliday junction resolvase
MMRILGVDPGEKRIGLAISDPTGTLARPLDVIPHSNRQADAAEIAARAKSNGAEKIIVGQATDIDGKPNYSGRKARRLAAAIRTHTEIPVEMWDESYSTKDAQRTRVILGQKKDQNNQHLDERAAAIILQSYLDAHPKDHIE